MKYVLGIWSAFELHRNVDRQLFRASYFSIGGPRFGIHTFRYGHSSPPDLKRLSQLSTTLSFLSASIPAPASKGKSIPGQTEQSRITPIRLLPSLPLPMIFSCRPRQQCFSLPQGPPCPLHETRFRESRGKERRTQGADRAELPLSRESSDSELRACQSRPGLHRPGNVEPVTMDIRPN